MFLVALCADSVDAHALRPALLAEHGAYLRSLASLRFSAPLARRDDATVAGAGVESSVIILEGDAWDGLLETLLADPYAAGGVWAQIDIYELTEPPNLPLGAHMVDLTADKRWYFLLNSGRSADPRCMRLDRRGGWGGEGAVAASSDILTLSGAGGWGRMRIFDAADLATASVSSLSPGGSGVSLTLAIPVAAGSWTKRE